MESKGKAEFSLTVRVMNGFYPKQLKRSIQPRERKSLRTIFQNSKGFKTSQEVVKKIIEKHFSVGLE